MKTISVTASQPYEVLIGSDLISQLGQYVSHVHAKGTAVIISDSNVWPLYGATAEKSLSDAGMTPLHFEFSAGEASKNAATYLEILNFLAEHKVTRADLIVALGGGVVGDIAGFVAATYLRGIAYIQVPTSILAMVDSSVGGKTAIDLPCGKNLVGAFKQPRMVLCDVSALNTLPTELFLDGCAEVIKYGILYDETLVEYLLETGPAFDRESVIAKCISFKADVVKEDEFDTGARQKLNLGHTIGHGIEAGSHFQITHGNAVAAGMTIVAKAAAANNLCKDDVYQTIVSLLSKFSLPTTTDLSADKLFTCALSDKKRSGSTVNLIVPRRIGQCDIIPFPVDALESFIKAGL